MNANNYGWELFREGKIKEALEVFHNADAEKRSYGTLANLGQAYLRIGQLRDAKQFLDSWAAWKFPRMEAAHAWAGTASWLLGEPGEACSVWVAGLDCPYRDMAGGFQLPLLLYAGATFHPNAFELDDARGLIKQRLDSPLSKHWPGPVGRFVVGELPEIDLMSLASENSHKKMRRFAVVHFYAGVLANIRKQHALFLNHLKNCIEIPESQSDPVGALAKYEFAVAKSGCGV